MINLLIETKNEYTIHLSNILAPLIYDGFQSIYKKALTISESNDILKIYQDFLKQIPEWNENTINIETNRITETTKSKEWLTELISATLKSNLVVLTFNPNSSKKNKIDSNLYKNIKINKFIHKVYIECAREIWNNPYLLYHEYPPIEIKRNQRDCIIIIKDCIKESIRKILQEYFKNILQIYLGEDLEENIDNNNFNETISEIDKRNIIKIAKKDLEINNFLCINDNEDEDDDDDNDNNNQLNKSNNNSDKTIGSKILDIINGSKPNQNNKSIKNIPNSISDTSIINKSNLNENISTTSIDNSGQNKSLSMKNGTNIKEINSENISNTPNSSIQKLKKKKISDINPEINDIDTKIKQILNKDLGSESDTSLINTHNNNTIEVFSNSNNSNSKKIFNNYLKF